MSRRYTRQQRDDALQHLDDNYGNVTLTALQTGIPARTLREWKRTRKLQAARDLPPKKEARRRQQTAANTDREDAEPQGDYTRIRARLMEHIDTLIETLTDDPDTAHIRAMALTRLLDRVIKLEALTRTEAPEQVIRVEYVYGDGSIHDSPPWADPETYEPFKPNRESIPRHSLEDKPGET